MKSFLPFAALVLAIIVRQAASQTPQAPAPVATGAIEGTITRAGTPEPIPGVTVQLNIAAAPNPTVLDTTSDEMGHFAFRNLYPGLYQLRYQIDGFFPAPDGVKSSVELGQRGARGGNGARGGFQVLAFTLDATQPVSMAIQMIPGGVISGRISDYNGRPIVSGQVSAMVLNYANGDRTLTSFKTAMTNDRGEYRLFGLEPGQYYVRAEYRSPSLPGLPLDVLRTYFPGVSKANDASTVLVRGGSESGGTNITIRPATTVKISGTVTVPASLTANATPIAAPGALPGLLFGAASAAAFYLEPLDAVGIRDDTVALTNTISNAADRAAGKFEFRNMSPGRYDLYAMIRTNPANVQERHVGRTTINVGNQDLDGVNIVITPGVDLRVRVTSKDPDAAAQTPTQFNLRMRSSMPAGLIQISQPAGRGGADRWRIYPALTEGQYVLDSPLASLRDAYVADIRQGDRSIYETGTIVVGNSAAEDVEVILARPAAAIDGSVLNAAGKPVSAASVVLIPDGERRQSPMLYKRAAAGADGHFSLRALAPGAYKLFAWELLPNGAELNAEFLKEYEERGVPVILEAGGQLKTQVPLIPAEN